MMCIQYKTFIPMWWNIERVSASTSSIVYQNCPFSSDLDGPFHNKKIVTE